MPANVPLRQSRNHVRRETVRRLRKTSGTNKRIAGFHGGSMKIYSEADDWLLEVQEHINSPELGPILQEKRSPELKPSSGNKSAVTKLR